MSETAMSPQEFLGAVYADAVKSARAVFDEKGAAAKYPAFKAASNRVAERLANVTEGSPEYPFGDRESPVHASWVSEAVLTAGLMGSLSPEVVFPTVSDMAALPKEFFAEVLPGIRNATARKLLFWAAALFATTGRVALNDIETARILRCPLSAVKKAMYWLMRNEYLLVMADTFAAYPDDALEVMDAEVRDNRTYFELNREKCSCLFRGLVPDTRGNGLTFCLSLCYYEFDATYWHAFAAAYTEAVDFLAVLTKGERMEVAELSRHLEGTESPMFLDELRRVAHLAATADEVAEEFGYNDAFDFAVEYPATRSAFMTSVMPVIGSTRATVHGRNRRERAYRIARRL